MAECKELKQERNEVIDLIKGFTIILVVLGHSIQQQLGTEMDSNLMFKIIYSFHMPLFMWISGYTYGCYGKDFSLKWLRKRFLGLVIPFWTWAIILYFFREAPYGETTLLQRLSILIESPDNMGLWFLLTVFYNCLLLAVSWNISIALSKLLKVERRDICYNLILLVLVITIYFLDFTGKIKINSRINSWYIAFFFCGFFVSKLKSSFSNICINISYRKVLIIVFLFVYVICMTKWNRLMNYESLFQIEKVVYRFLYQVYRYLVPISAIIVVYNVMNIIANSKLNTVKNVLIELGKNTISIYAIHYIFMPLYIGYPSVNILLRTTVGITMAYLIGKCISKNKFLNCILLGGRVS